MKKMMWIIVGILVILNVFFGYNTYKNSKKEIVNLSKFADYYTESIADNGGYQLLDENFKVYEKEYTIRSDEKKEESKKRVETIYYTVKSGDTLGGIANKYGQLQAVLKYNNPNMGKYLKVGEKLKITGGNTITYKVVRGDSISKIASKFGKTATELKSTNNLSSDVVNINQILTIKDPKINFNKTKATTSDFNMYWPVKWAGVTSPYGRRFHPVLKKWIGHKGVDLRAHYVPLKASESGTVTYAGWMTGYGKIVIIQHKKGYETRYAHLDKIQVKKGQKVRRGELIGITGKTGRVTGPHLHFEVRKNNTPIDPMKYYK